MLVSSCASEWSRRPTLSQSWIRAASENESVNLTELDYAREGRMARCRCSYFGIFLKAHDRECKSAKTPCLAVS